MAGQQFDDPDYTPQIGDPELGGAPNTGSGNPYAHTQGPQAYSSGGSKYAYTPEQAEPLPGITSGPAPKPWGLDRSQLPVQKPYESGFGKTIERVRPADMSVDPSMEMNMTPPDSYAYQWQGKGVRVPSGRLRGNDADPRMRSLDMGWVYSKDRDI